MNKFFRPDYYVRSYREIDPSRLRGAGIRLLLCDIDNTLWNLEQGADFVQIELFISRMKAAGIDVALMSNNTRKHVSRIFTQDHQIPVYTFSCKPLPITFWKALKEYGLRPAQAAIVGDQLFTDMAGGRLSGLYTILSAPLSSEERKDTKIVRYLENVIYRRLEKNGVLKRGKFDG